MIEGLRLILLTGKSDAKIWEEYNIRLYLSGLVGQRHSPPLSVFQEKKALPKKML